MNYDEQILAILESLKTDKSIPAEYRNAVLSTGKRWRMEIRGVKTLTNLQPPEEFKLSTDPSDCICPTGGHRKDCPVHGWKA